MHLACVLLHLSMPEALAAATINAAASLGKSDTHGSLEVGKLADMIVIDAPRYRNSDESLSKICTGLLGLLGTLKCDGSLHQTPFGSTWTPTGPTGKLTVLPKPCWMRRGKRSEYDTNDREEKIGKEKPRTATSE